MSAATDVLTDALAEAENDLQALKDTKADVIRAGQRAQYDVDEAARKVAELQAALDALQPQKHEGPSL